MLGRALFGGLAIALLSSSVVSSTVQAEVPVVLCGGVPATIIGTDGNDFLRGTPGPDVMHGLDGHDLIKGFGGDDIICGGKGSDDIYAHEGNDIIYGGPDNDSVEGGAGDDIIYLGGTGAFDPRWEHSLRDGNIACGDCAPDGSFGNDIIIGGPGNDGCILTGPYKGGWWVSGGGGDDFIDLKGGDDCATGDDGNDTFFGRGGDDKFSGGRGRDVADGGRGANVCQAQQRSRCGWNKPLKGAAKGKKK